MEFVNITLKNGEVFTVPAETHGQFLAKRGISLLEVQSIGMVI